ncbi:MAG: biotin--[acetyl-CoA-carboxylase] ligase [Cytophagaceae bacterium]
MYNIPADTLFIGKRLIHLPACHSTNTVAHEMVSEGNAEDGTVIISSEQTAGQGQRGNSWESEPGKNLTFSVILSPGIRAGHQFWLNIISCLAVSALVSKYAGDKVRVKWPNDIYFKDRKICGILIRNYLQGADIRNSIIGIGLNINQTAFKEPRAISLANICGEPFSLPQLLEELLTQLDFYADRLRKGYLKELKEQYLSQLYWSGEQHLFKTEYQFSGTITGIDDNGFLIVKTDEGEKYFNFKEIEFVS